MGESATATANGRAAGTPDASAFIKVEIGELVSLDPAGPYDTRSWEVMANVYETLLARTLSGFAPRLARVVPTVDNGLVSADGLRYEFPIRQDVRFHGGEVLTAEDVAYSLRRLLVADIPGGPAWMLMEPLLGVSNSRADDDGGGGLQFGFGDVEQAIRAEGDRVVLRLRYPFASLPAILATPPASIFPRSWAAGGGEWPGTAETFEAFNRRPLTESFLHKHMNGTGPYRFVAWEPDVRVDLARHPGYWGTPALLDRVVIYKENDWAGRRDALLSGEADMVQVDRTFVPEIAGNPTSPSMTICRFRCVTPSRSTCTSTPTTTRRWAAGAWTGREYRRTSSATCMSAAASSTRSTGIGSSTRSTWARRYRPKARSPRRSSATIPTSRSTGSARSVPRPSCGKPGTGRLWEAGFRLTLVFNTGNFLRRMWATLLADQLREINPRFILETKGVDLPEWRRLLSEGKLAIFTAGWLVDYLDPHNFVQPLMSSSGLWARWQSYTNPEAD